MDARLWNIDYDLIDDRFDIELADRLFREELNETLKAIRERDWVEIFDGLCDMKFIGDGNIAKCAFALDVSESITIQKSAYNQIKDIVVGLIDSSKQGVFEAILDECYQKVVEANYTKPKEKVNGKVIKGESFKSPNDEIRKILIREGIINE